MKEIQLTQGKVALVDDEDFERVSKSKWCAFKMGNTFYAVSWHKMIKGERGPLIFLHRFLLEAKKGEMIDHRDRDGLNNRRHNLRFCNPSQNGCNRKFPENKTGYCGVYFYPLSRGGFFAQIRINKRKVHLGVFADANAAAMAYNKAAILHRGEFAILNKIRA